MSIAATAMDPDPGLPAEVRARCRALWAEYASVVGGRRLFESSRGLLKRADVEEPNELAEAERQLGEFTPLAAVDAPVYSATDSADGVPELKACWYLGPRRCWPWCSAAGSDERWWLSLHGTRWPYLPLLHWWL